MIKYNSIKDYPKPGVRFIDLTPSIYDADSFSTIIELILDKIDELNVPMDYIVAPESRGFIWASAVAYAKGIPLVTVRKRGKLPPGTIGGEVRYETEYSEDVLQIPHISLLEKRCIYIDDVYATGGTYQACKDLVRLQGGSLDFGIVIYDVGIQDNEEIIPLFRGDEL